MAKFVTFFLLCFSLLSAEIIESRKLEEVLNHIEPDAWVFFDIDDTVIESELQWGRSKWYFYEVQKLMDQGLDNTTAQKKFYPSWVEAQKICPIRTPEPITVDLVRKVQERCDATMGLTARHLIAIETTLDQLASLSIDFKTSCLAQIPQIDFEEPIDYKGGVFFITDFNKKGKVLRQLLEKSENRPSKIVFIDDGLHHLVSAEKELADLDVEFVGVHYTKTFERPFNSEIAERESLFK
ncbi:MAG: DUF2608 domain-containing protein [Verrucomicrobia bacterium]|nr:DUF2608 domain-containing protein [Verrucomicrobiota bacterium]